MKEGRRQRLFCRASISIAERERDSPRLTIVIRTVDDGPRHLLEDRLLPLGRVKHPVEGEGLRRLHRRARLLRCERSIVGVGWWVGRVSRLNRMSFIHPLASIRTYSHSVISTVCGEGTERHMKSPPDFISSNSVGGRMRATTRTLPLLPLLLGGGGDSGDDDDLAPRSVDLTVESGDGDEAIIVVVVLALLALLACVWSGSGGGGDDDEGRRVFEPWCGKGDRGGARGKPDALDAAAGLCICFP